MKKKELLSDIVYVLLVVGLALFIVTFIGQRVVVSGSSMEPYLSDGDMKIVNKVKYRFSEPERFDVIVFPNPNDTSSFLIKRIIGLPGETIQIRKGTIYINGEVLHEDYGLEVMRDEGIALEKINIGTGEYFVLGDNRNNSLDSRNMTIGLISKENIIGRVK